MNIKTIIREFFDPRFSTLEIEKSKLRCNLSFGTTDMYFDDEKRGFPTHVVGFIKTRRGHCLPSSWNKYGECKMNGKRIKAFDLVRPSRLETAPARPVINSILFVMIIILVGIIF